MTDLQTRMAEAIAKNDMAAMEQLAAEIIKTKGDRHKAEAEKLRAEAESLAGSREKLEATILKAVVPLNLNVDLKAVKARGFSLYIETIYSVAGEPDVHQKASCKLLVPTVKSKGTSTASTGKSKDEFGMSLSEIVAQFATPEELAAITEPEITNSRSWQLKVAVKKRAIANGLLAPVK